VSVNFYVQAPAANYTLDWEAGIVLALLAIFISVMIVVPRRSRSRKNP